MVEKNNATCSICGNAYYLCLSCRDKMELAPWKVHTDTAEHYKIYQILRGFNTGVYSKEEAKSKLQTVDLSDLDNLRDTIRNCIKDIMKEQEQIDIVKDVNSDVVENNVSKLVDIGKPVATKESVKDIFVSNLNTARKKKSYKVVETE